MPIWLAKLVRDTKGVAAVEYGLIAALIAVMVLSAFQQVGTNLSMTFRTIALNL